MELRGASLILLFCLQELLSKKEKLQADIRKETDLIDHYKVRLDCRVREDFLRTIIDVYFWMLQKLIHEKQTRLADSCEESVRYTVNQYRR